VGEKNRADIDNSNALNLFQPPKAWGKESRDRSVNWQEKWLY